MVAASELVWRDVRIERAELGYWRTSIGEEVDFVVEPGGKLLPIEGFVTTSFVSDHQEDGRLEPRYPLAVLRGKYMCLSCSSRSIQLEVRSCASIGGTTMNITRAWIPSTLGLLLVLSGPSFAQSRSEESREKPIQMTEVPQAARDAAEKALGVAPTEAKIVQGTSPQQYELEAKTASGKEVAVHVLANGKVVKKEKEGREHHKD